MKILAGTMLAASAALFAGNALADDAALKALGQGGHAVLMRHARTDGHSKALVLDLNGNCANEDNLSEEGQAQARRMVAVMKKAGVAFDVVLASPFCRTRQTAQLVFGAAKVEPALTALELGTAEQAKARTQAITAFLARQSGKGNVALVTHRPNIDALTMELVPEGAAIVAKIGPDGTLDVVGTIKP